MVIDGSELRVVSAGDGRPVLWCTGLAQSIDVFAGLWSDLRDHRCIGFDPPGIGASSARAGGRSVARLADLAAAVLDAAETGPVTVVGYSFGGAVAQQLTRRRPDLVSSLVLVATSWGAGSVPGVPLVLGRHARPVDLGVAAAQAVSFLGWSSLPWLRRIRQPTWVVVGAHDVVVPPVNGWLLASAIPGARVRVLPADHHGILSSGSVGLAEVVREAAGAAPSRRRRVVR